MASNAVLLYRQGRLPQLENMKPFCIRSGDQFRSDPGTARIKHRYVRKRLALSLGGHLKTGHTWAPENRP